MSINKFGLIAIAIFFSLSSASIGYTTSFDYVTNYDFSEVEVGFAKHTSVNIVNTSEEELKLFFTFTSGSNFVWFPEPLNSIVIAAKASINLDIAFIPTSIGHATANLFISDGSPFNSGLVKFDGTGLKPKPKVRIEDIIDFYDTSVLWGKIVGNQKGIKRSAYQRESQYEKDNASKSSISKQNRLNAFRNMMLSAAKDIEEENFVTACEQLSEVYAKTDGQIPPTSSPDFVYGESKQELADMITTLRRQFECD